MEKRIYLSPPHMGGEERKYIDDAFETGWIAPLGSNVDRFEALVRDYIGAQAAVALASGTAAIHLALLALGVGAGDDVLCSDLTFSGSCNPIRYLQANPVFVDADRASWCICPDALEVALTDAKRRGKLPKAAIVVDLYGLPAQYDRLLPLLRHYKIPLLEDAAEALGSVYNGRMCGAFGEVAALSFNGNKIITTSGGGMAVTNRPALAARMLHLATQAREPAAHYEHREIGYNYRLSNICAGIGAGQMERLEQFVAARRRVARRYREGLAGLPLRFAPRIPGAQPNDWLTVIELDERCGVTPAAVMRRLEAANIESRPCWKPMHMQPVFADCAFYSATERPAGEALFASGLCLPSGSALTDAQQDRVIDIVRGAFA